MRKTKKPSGGYQLTPEHAEHFWSCLFAWQERLGLTDWRITRSSQSPPGKAIASMQDWEIGQRQVSCRLNENWSSQEPTAEAIEQTAVHELLHVMLADLIELALTPGTTREDMESSEHAIINRLEKLFVPGEGGT